MPGAIEPTILEAVHSTCKEVAQLHPGITINQDAIQSYLQQLDVAAVRAAGSRATVFPIKFDNLEAEVNFLCLFHLLDFGSGYDDLLQASSCKRGAAETIQYGCFGLALSAARLDGPWMRSFSAYHVHTAFGIESKVEEELQPGITISKPGPLAPLAAAIQSAIVETGNILGQIGVKSLGAFVLGHLNDLKAAGKPFTAASLVQELSNSFPAFQDSGLYTPPLAAAAAEDQQQQQQQSIKVEYARKAQSLAADLGARFGQEDERFRWTDAEKLSADSGAVLPAALRQLGILTYSPELAAAIDPQQQQQQQQYLPRGNDECAIRAAAVAAVDQIVAAAVGSSGGSSSNGFTAREFSSYLLSLVKEGEGQQQGAMFQGQALQVHRTLGTMAY